MCCAQRAANFAVKPAVLICVTTPVQPAINCKIISCIGLTTCNLHRDRLDWNFPS